ncbi:F-box-like protein [Ceratobasidium sp. AG-Ba]|nr:F-box-like protein [Ceratobasidium sp. AG-Ba]QRV91721.1 F-box-like protein [Ceratobasidium sp. AG-Ba]
MQTETIDDPYLSTFDRWKKTYERFTLALDSLRKETIGLDAIIQQADMRKWSGSEEALQYVDAVHESLETRISEIRGIHLTLGTVRNQSRTLVPFNRLPIETIVYILSLANTECLVDLQDQSQRPLLQRLCRTSRYLRNIVIRAPSLWTHVDMITERADASDHGKSCVQFSGRLPLHIHIFEDEGSTRPYQYFSLAAVLRPCIGRITALHIKGSAQFAAGFLSLLWKEGTSSQVQEFYFSDHMVTSPPYYNNFFSTFEARSTMFEENLRRFKMHGPFVPLNSSVYRGLTVLKLVPSESPPTMITHIVDVFVACPDLCSLSLVSVEVEAHPDETRRVALPQLEVLDLRLVFGASLDAILSRISRGSDNLALNVSIPWDPDNWSEDMLRRHIKDLKVVRLLSEAPTGRGTLSWLFGGTSGDELSGVRELALVDYEMVDLPDNFISNTRRFSGLHTLHLLRGTVNRAVFHRAFFGSAIRTVWTEGSIWPREPQNQIHQPSELVPLMMEREYSVLCQGEGDLEWPVYTP